MSHYYLLPFKYEINKGSNQNKIKIREKKVYRRKIDFGASFLYF